MLIFYLLSFALIANGIYQLIKYFLIISTTNSITPSFEIASQTNHKIIVLVPVLHEEKTIEYLLKNLSNQNYPKEWFDVYIITTQREYNIETILPNTIDVLNFICSKSEFSEINLNTIHYPHNNSFKSDQLNFAFNYIRDKSDVKEISEYYFLILDADGQLKPDSLKTFNNSIEFGLELYQQVYLRFKNIYEINNPLMESAAFLQSFYAFSSELPMYTNRFFPIRLKHFMGHGFLIKGSYLIKINGFPEMLEDLRLGRLSSFLKDKVKLIPDYGIVENAKKLSIYLKQISVWFFGSALFLQDYKQACIIRKSKLITFSDLKLIIYGFFKCSRWLNEGLLHLVGLIYSIILGSLPIFTLFLFSLLINSAIPAFLASQNLKILWQKKSSRVANLKINMRGVLFSPILYIISFLGLYLGLFRLLKFHFNNKLYLPKTIR